MPEQQNYESRFWGLIYDQMMARDLAGWVEQSRRFYGAHLAGTRGPVLEGACGTGLILLHLLEQEVDVRGFDVSRPMLDRLVQKAPHARGRVSQQSLESFRYDQRFGAVIVPTNSFSMLTSREAQQATLANIHRHLLPGGRLLMDFRLADDDEPEAAAEGVVGRWHEWIHPESGDVIRQRIVSLPHDVPNQGYRDLCIIEYGEVREEFPMNARWVYRAEFEALLRDAGFVEWQVEIGEWGSYWHVLASGSGSGSG